MKSSKVFVKRSQSPSQPPKTIQVSDRKKKSSSNTHLQPNHPKKTLKQFDTYGKTTEKKRNNYLKQLLKNNNNEQTNKYRIVTEPVQERLLYLGNNNFGNTNTSTNNNNNIMKNGSTVIKLPSKSKIQSSQHNHQFHHQYTQKYLKLNIRTSQTSKQKLKTGESFHRGNQQCRNCQKYRQQLQHFKKELNKICMDKILWKSGQMHIDDVKESFFKLKDKNNLMMMKSIDSSDVRVNSNGKVKHERQQRHKTSVNSVEKQQKQYEVEYGRGAKQQLTFQDNNYKNTKYRSPSQQSYQYTNDREKLPYTKIIDKQLAQIKKHIIDLMSDIQSLSAIDYPKMLSLNIFKYDPFYVQSPSSQQVQLKQLLGQLRHSMQGRVSDQDLVDVFGNGEMSEHNRMIFRNLKNRLSHYLRENFQLRIKKQVLQRSQQITRQSQQYLRKVIEDVLLTYVDAINGQE